MGAMSGKALTLRAVMEDLSLWLKRRGSRRRTEPALLGLGWALLSLIFLACGASCNGQSWFLDSQLQVKKAVVPIYLNFEREAAGIIRADNIHGGYQTKGFFRIGALPSLVIEGLTIELRDLIYP